jgi:hypothetical protein
MVGRGSRIGAAVLGAVVVGSVLVGATSFRGSGNAAIAPPPRPPREIRLRERAHQHARTPRAERAAARAALAYLLAAEAQRAGR